jgi:hypothetical protein
MKKNLAQVTLKAHHSRVKMFDLPLNMSRKQITIETMSNDILERYDRDPH